MSRSSCWRSTCPSGSACGQPPTGARRSARFLTELEALEDEGRRHRRPDEGVAPERAGRLPDAGLDDDLRRTARTTRRARGRPSRAGRRATRGAARVDRRRRSATARWRRSGAARRPRPPRAGSRWRCRPAARPPRLSATQVRRYQPPSGCGARSRAAISDSPGRTRSLPGLRRNAQDWRRRRASARRHRRRAHRRLGPLDEEVASRAPR